MPSRKKEGRWRTRRTSWSGGKSNGDADTGPPTVMKPPTPSTRLGNELGFSAPLLSVHLLLRCLPHCSDPSRVHSLSLYFCSFLSLPFLGDQATAASPPPPLFLALFPLPALLDTMVLSNDIDLLHPPAELEKTKHKLKRLVQSPNSFFMDVKCQGCFSITTVFSHSQTVVLCGSCSTVLCQPTGGRARLTEGCSFRKKGE
eukprot:XP_024360748.1 uncharacterized protein LOC112275043 [Physcomitrella patens]